MTGLRELQTAFAEALRTGDDTALRRRLVPTPRGGPDRFPIFRNHRLHTLVGTLDTVYPALARLMGPTTFKALCVIYGTHGPSTTPNLNEFGAELDHLLVTFAPAQPYPYLVDVARFEWARHRAFHAPGVVPLTPQALSERASHDCVNLRFRFHRRAPYYR